MARQAISQIGIITKPNEPRAVTVVALIAEWCKRNRVALQVNDRIGTAPSPALLAPDRDVVESSDLLVVLGGDGTMITAARLIGSRGTPVLGINMGSLGYLTEFTVADAVSAVEGAAGGDYELDRRAMLDWRVLRDGSEVSSGSVLNDVVVNKSTLARIIEIDCFVDDHHVTSYRADGLIVATPTGSTAYNLSAGGPIIYPRTEAISIAPICSHALTNRPLVLPDSVLITLQLVTSDEQVMVTSDGQTGLPLNWKDKVQIKKSEKIFNMVRPAHREYFQTLREKLKWGGH